MKIRNPWGMKEWTGPWADFGPEWEHLRETFPDAPDWMVNYKGEYDGTFWMLFEDFCKYYNMIYVCIHFPSSWSEEVMKGRWNAGNNSGGCPDKHNEWWLNPCYKISVSTRTQLFISMSQWDSRCYGNKVLSLLAFSSTKVHILTQQTTRTSTSSTTLCGTSTKTPSASSSPPRYPIPYPHVCSCILTYAHLCSRMLMYPHLCSRMLTSRLRSARRREMQAQVRAS